MLLTAVLFLIFANIVNHSAGIKQDVKTFFLSLVYLWIILIFTFRDNSVPDTQNYINIYNSPSADPGIEYLFTLLCKTGNLLGLSFNGFLFVYQVILFGSWFYISKKLFKDIHLAFMVFLPFMGIYNFGIIIRAGMGLSLCYAAIVYLIYNRTVRGYIFYYSMVTIAVFFHQAMIVFYLLPLFLFRNFNPVVLLTVLIIALIIPLLNIQRLISDFLESYIKLFSLSQFFSYTQVHANFDIRGVYSLTMIKYWLMAMLFIWLRKRITEKKDVYNCFLNIYISGVFLISLTHFITAGNRLSYMFFFFEFALVAMIFEYSSLPKKVVFIGAIGLGVLNYLNLISAIPIMITY
jgi:hypothetical protein